MLKRIYCWFSEVLCLLLLLNTALSAQWVRESLFGHVWSPCPFIKGTGKPTDIGYKAVLLFYLCFDETQGRYLIRYHRCFADAKNAQLFVRASDEGGRGAKAPTFLRNNIVNPRISPSGAYLIFDKFGWGLIRRRGLYEGGL